MRAYIAGIGMHVPEKVMTNADMEKLMDTSDEWITERSGIKERHFATPGDGPSDLALPAAKEALAMANLAPEDIDLIMFSTIAGDYMLPGGGCILNELLNIPGTRRWTSGYSVLDLFMGWPWRGDLSRRASIKISSLQLLKFNP